MLLFILNIHCVSPEVLLVSSIAAACLLSCGVFELHTGPPTRLHNSTARLGALFRPPESVLCLSSGDDLMRSWRHAPHVFTGRETNWTVFLSNNADINDFLTNRLTFYNEQCGNMYENGVYCCMYNKDDNITYTKDFTFARKLVKDPYFRIEDFFYGKADVIHIDVGFAVMTSHRGDVSVHASHHRLSRGHLDPYPEIHIYVDDGTRLAEFHWYL